MIFWPGRAARRPALITSSNTYATQAGRVSNLLGNTHDGSHDLAAEFRQCVPGGRGYAHVDTGAADAVESGETLMQRMQSYDDSLRNFDAQVNSQLESEADTITAIASSLARLNQEITGAMGRTGQPPNDLMDQRDKLIDELSTHINVNVVAQGDGARERIHRQWPAAGGWPDLR